MAELTDRGRSSACCAPEAQATCCEPADKADCCAPDARDVRMRR